MKAVIFITLFVAVQAYQFPWLKSSIIPTLVASNFPNHTLIELPDGNFVPSPAFGTGSIWHVPENRVHFQEAIENALRVGYRHIDTSAIYQTEELVGKAIRKLGIKREEIYITTKYDRLGGESVEVEFQKSLDNLGVDYIDLYLIHFPQVAPDAAKVWESFQKLVSENKIRSIGISNYDTPELINTFLDDIAPVVRIPPVINQIKYHLYNQKHLKDALAVLLNNDIQVAGYSTLTPLTRQAGGPLDEVLDKITKETSYTNAQVILDWVKHNSVLAVTTSRNATHQEEQLAPFASTWKGLGPRAYRELEEAGRRGTTN